MKSVFADSDYFIAELNPKEQLHHRARSVSQNLGRVRIVTSEMVLAEVLAFYADKGAALREAAAGLAASLAARPNATIVPQTSLQFQELSHFTGGTRIKTGAWLTVLRFWSCAKLEFRTCHTRSSL